MTTHYRNDECSVLDNLADTEFYHLYALSSKKMFLEKQYYIACCFQIFVVVFVKDGQP